jgi:tight adherence protein B
VTGVGWLALAAALLVVGAPSALSVRVLALSRAERVSAIAPGAARMPRLPWRHLLPLGVLASVIAAGLAVGPALALALALVLGVVGLLARDATLGRAAARRRVELLVAVRLLVAELDAGGRPPDALHAAADVAPSYADVLQDAARAAQAGDDPGAVLAADDATRALGVAWQVVEETGAAPGAVLAHIARDLSAVDDQRRAVAVALSGPRSSAAVLTGLPLLGIALGAAMGARPLPFLFAPGAGRVVCTVGIALDAAGVLWMRRIVRRAQAAP